MLMAFRAWSHLQYLVLQPSPTSTGWWLTYASEKYESQLGLLFPIYGKIKDMFQATNQSIIDG
jgi:hypothetical protein